MSLQPSVQLHGSAQTAPPEVLGWAERIADKHQCPVQLRLEASGYHLYIPCPDCLETHKKDEINDPKYSINLSKVCGLGDYGAPVNFNPAYAMDHAERRNAMLDRSSSCMRTWQSKKPHRYSMSELLDMQTVTIRHPDIHTRASVIGRNMQADRESQWVLDPYSGKMAPPSPGSVIPVTQLPPYHPAAMYLTARGFDLARLESQFRCGFCETENSAMKYPTLVDHWRDTPQGRIIFYGMREGIPVTWQARYMEVVSDTARTLWHPYRAQWVVVATRVHPESPWIPIPPYDAVDDRGKKRFNLSKYKTATASERGIMGWDAALARANSDDHDLKWVVLCEGPLDAARVGPGGLALMGASLNMAHADLISRNFDIVFTAFDNDKAGQTVTERISSILMSDQLRSSRIQSVNHLPVVGGKDLGEMKQQDFDSLFSAYLKRELR